MASTVAKPVTAVRAKIPSVAASVCPSDLLKGDKRETFENQQTLVLDEETPDPPKSCHMISPDEEVRLRHRLLSSGAALLMPVAKVPQDKHGRMIAGGLFAVAHSVDFDRLFFDRRRANHNHSERRLGWIRLPLGAMLSRLRLDRTQSVRGHGYDLSTYFSQLREHQSGLDRNAFGRSFL